jgi:outer membrane immunogenic protein
MKVKMSIAGLALACSMLAGAVAALADGMPRYGGARYVPYSAPYSAPFSWTGFYIGLHAGGGWSDGHATADPFPSPAAFNLRPGSADFSDSGFIGGMQAGYNLSVGPNWVAGIEVDWSWSDIGSTVNDQMVTFGGVPAPGAFMTFSRDVNWLASVRGRLGYTFDRLLLYFTGGAAWGEFDYSASTPSVPPAGVWATSFSETTNGYVIGGGLEWAFAERWMLRAEYLHYHFSGTNAALASTPVFPGFTIGYKWDDTSIDVVRAALSYKFSSGPIW